MDLLCYSMYLLGLEFLIIGKDSAPTVITRPESHSPSLIGSRSSPEQLRPNILRDEGKLWTF